MSRIKQASPALVISIIALIAALVVPAVAQVATKALTKREVRRVRNISRFQANRQITRRTPRIANRRITARAPGLSVASANGVANGAVGTGQLSGSIPAAGVRLTGNQSSLNNVATTLSFDTERYDTANLHSNTTNNSRLTAPVDGIYAVSALVSWAADDLDGQRLLEIEKNGTVLIASANQMPVTVNGASTTQSLTKFIALAAGDYVEAMAFQNSGSTLNVLGPEFELTWVAPGP
jgi:hypothetical protein